MGTRRLRLLLVEDNEDDYLYVRDLLGDIQGPPFELTWKTDGHEGLEAIESHLPDVCLFDYRLGEVTGLELLREARLRGFQSPVILLTGQGDHDVDMQAMEAGASDYLVKDQLHSGLLERSIRYALERQRQEVVLAERAQLAALGADVGSVLTQRDSLSETLRLCAEAISAHLANADVGIWSLEEGADTLVLQTAVGPGAAVVLTQQPVRIGDGEVGVIARDRKMIVLNRSGSEGDDDGEGFAGFPLMVEARLVGVMSVNARSSISEFAFRSLATLADEIALGIERKRTEEELRKSRDELEVRVHERTAELHKATDSMQAAKEEAERANRSKSEFLSRMSHELRTPLNAILGFGQLLELDDLTEEQTESIGHILKAGHHLLDLINEVLDISRVEAGRMDLSIEPVNVREIVREGFDLVKPLAVQFGVTCVEALDGQADCLVAADRQRFKQVLLNLLSNAIKYNSEHGTVTVNCVLQPNARLRLQVTDTGAGLEPEDVSRLFTPFERLNAGKTEIQGTGLGLSLSKRLIDAMQGTLGVESQPGRGSTFYIELPLSGGAQLSPECGTDDRPANVDAYGGAQRPIVLFIEDNTSNYRLVESMLNKFRPGVQLVGAKQGAVGMELARQRHPDLILLDLHLPDMNGFDILLQLRAAPETANTAIVIVSADATEPQIANLISAGANHYLTKPLNLREFLECLDNILLAKTA